MIAHAAPPAPVIAAPAVSFGHIAVRLGPGTRRIEVQADGRITARRSVPPGPRRLSVPIPAGVHPVRVRAIGSGGSRWSATVRVRALPRSALRAGRIPGWVDRRLQGDIDRLVAGMPAISGVYVQHLVTGCGASSNADAQFPAASTLKAAILVDAVRRGPGGTARRAVMRPSACTSMRRVPAPSRTAMRPKLTGGAAMTGAGGAAWAITAAPGPAGRGAPGSRRARRR